MQGFSLLGRVWTVAAISDEGRALASLTLSISDVSLESSGHSFLLGSSAASRDSLADLLPQAGRWAAVVAFTLWTEDS